MFFIICRYTDKLTSMCFIFAILHHIHYLTKRGCGKQGHSQNGKHRKRRANYPGGGGGGSKNKKNKNG
jgi:hypothetical protein